MHKRIVCLMMAVALVLAIILPGCTEKEVEKKHEVNVDVEGVISQQPVIE